jgi:hypothetical protein
MLQKLAGRLRWDRTEGGICVEIPARRDWWSIPLAILLCAWSAGGWFYEANTALDDTQSVIMLITILGATVGAIFFVLRSIWAMTGQTVLILDTAELKIQRRAIGLDWYERHFAAQDAYNLRYIQPREIWAFRTDTDPSTSKVTIQSLRKTYTIAHGISEREACALIDRMMEVYVFPKNTPLEQVGIAR